MEQVTQSTKERAIEILMVSLRDVPGALRVIKKDYKFEARLRAFCVFCANVGMLRDGAYITSDGNGVAMIFDPRNRGNSLKIVLEYLKLGNRCISWERVIPVLWRQRRISAHRAKEDFLQFWILGVKDNSYGLKTIIEIRDFAYEMSRDLQLPIVAETTIERNLRLYERYGFECYGTYSYGPKKSMVYYIKRKDFE